MTARQPQRRPDLGALPGPWVNDAACRDSEYPDAWFATDEKSAEIAYARSVCRACEVRGLCLEFALSLTPGESHGVWGGTLPEERRQIWRTKGSRA